MINPLKTPIYITVTLVSELTYFAATFIKPIDVEPISMKRIAVAVDDEFSC